MRVKIINRYWNIVRKRLGYRMIAGKKQRVGGQCTPPYEPKKEIRIDPTCKGQCGLRVVIHEMLHAAQWNLDEDFVDDLSSDMGQVLWRLGYRPTNKDWP